MRIAWECASLHHSFRYKREGRRGRAETLCETNDISFHVFLLVFCKTISVAKRNVCMGKRKENLEWNCPSKIQAAFLSRCCHGILTPLHLIRFISRFCFSYFDYCCIHRSLLFFHSYCFFSPLFFAWWFHSLFCSILQQQQHQQQQMNFCSFFHSQKWHLLNIHSEVSRERCSTAYCSHWDLLHVSNPQ